MGTSWNDLDEQGTTCSYCLSFPASPHLAARLAGTTIQPEIIRRDSEILAAGHEFLLVEGAGGLLVPLSEELLLLDYLQQCGYPLILVTSPRLGSINHTLLALEAIKSRNINLLGLVYNLHGNNPLEIVRDSLQVFKQALLTYGFTCPTLLLPDYKETRAINWQPLLAGIA
jgi:dethiobiotin synthetase